MSKFLLFVALIATVYYVFFAKNKPLSSTKNDNSMDEAMIPCTTCGTYIQTKEALMSSGKHYCSPECMEKK